MTPRHSRPGPSSEGRLIIPYAPKAWLRLTFSLGGRIIPRVAWRVGVLVALTSACLAIKELVPAAEPVFRPFKPLAHTLIGVALGLLLVFRNNCSYDRYWEGRKLWGAIVNNSRNLVRRAAAYAGGAGGLAGLVSGYALALKQHLRGSKDLDEVRSLVPPVVFDHAASVANPPSALAFHMSAWVKERTSAGNLDPVTAQSLEAHVRALLDAQGGCERILRTPIPFAYAVHIKQLLVLYLVTLPLILIGELNWVAIPAVAAIGFGMLGIEEAGVEIEDPFGDDPNDLPIATIARDTQALADAPKVAAG